LNVHRVSDVRQIKILAAEPLVPDPLLYDVEIAIENLKIYKLPYKDQIPAELIQAGGDILRSNIHKVINSIWNKEELPGQWKESIIVLIREKGNKADCSNNSGISLLTNS
jgi:hypothetical protein